MPYSHSLRQWPKPCPTTLRYAHILGLCPAHAPRARPSPGPYAHAPRPSPTAIAYDKAHRRLAYGLGSHNFFCLNFTVMDIKLNILI